MAIKYNPYNWNIEDVEKHKLRVKTADDIKYERDELIRSLNSRRDDAGYLEIDMYIKTIREKNDAYFMKYMKEHEE